jgi:hypothetical protein
LVVGDLAAAVPQTRRHPARPARLVAAVAPALIAFTQLVNLPEARLIQLAHKQQVVRVHPVLALTAQMVRLVVIRLSPSTVPR